MNIVISINQKYVPFAYVMLFSLYSNNQSEKIRLFILHSELSQNDLEPLYRLSTEFHHSVTPLPVNPGLFPSELPTTAVWSREAFYRLALLDLLPDDIDRILYLDVDMIILHDLSSFYHTPFDGSHFIACDDADPFGINFPERQSIFAEAYANGHRYFNSGVMIWNLSILRGSYSLSDYLLLAKKLNYRMVTVDQDLLNYMHCGHIKYASPNYNYFARMRSNNGESYNDALHNAYIVHYLSEKPWNADGFHFDIEKIWWEYAKQTPYYLPLLEAFLDKTLTDRTIFQNQSELYNTNRQLQRTLNESLSLNQKLYGMIK